MATAKKTIRREFKVLSTAACIVYILFMIGLRDYRQFHDSVGRNLWIGSAVIEIVIIALFWKIAVMIASGRAEPFGSVTKKDAKVSMIVLGVIFLGGMLLLYAIL